jgi:hypothetical protein
MLAGFSLPPEIFWHGTIFPSRRNRPETSRRTSCFYQRAVSMRATSMLLIALCSASIFLAHAVEAYWAR